jgi:tetratricopeptide (TPR) repeat protein
MNSTPDLKKVTNGDEGNLLPVVLLLLITLLAPYPAFSSDNKAQSEIDLRWIDLGRDLGKEAKTHDWRSDPKFKAFPRKIELFDEIPSSGQIFVPMPLPEHTPKTDAEWRMFEDYLFNGIQLRIKEGLARGTRAFVIQTSVHPDLQEQSGTLSGAKSTVRDGRFLVQCARALLRTMAKLKHDFDKNGVRMSCHGLFSGNSGRVVTRALVIAPPNSLDALVTVDSRASLGETLKASAALNGKLAIVGVQRDSVRDGTVLDPEMVKLLKLFRPGVRILQIPAPPGQLDSGLLISTQESIVTPSELAFEDGVPRYQITEKSSTRKLLENLMKSVASGTPGKDFDQERNLSTLRSTLDLTRETVNGLRPKLEIRLNPDDFAQLVLEFSAIRRLIEGLDSQDEDAKQLSEEIAELFGNFAETLIEALFEGMDDSEAPDDCELLAASLQNACEGAGKAASRATKAFSSLWPDTLRDSASEGQDQANEWNCRIMGETLKDLCRRRPFIPLLAEAASPGPPPPDDHDGNGGGSVVPTPQAGYKPDRPPRRPSPVSVRLEKSRLDYIKKLSHRRKIIQAILKEDWAEANELLTHYMGISHDPMAKILMATVSLARNQNNEAVMQFMAFARGKNMKAWLALAKEIAQEHPNNYISHFFEGEALAGSGQLKSAIAPLKKAMELNPSSPIPPVTMGMVYLAMEELDPALVHFDAATQVDPNSVAALTGLAETLARLGLTVAALKSLGKALALDPDNPYAKDLESNLKHALETEQDSTKIQDEWKNYPPNGVSTRELLRTPIDRGDRPIAMKFGLWYGGKAGKANE